MLDWLANLPDLRVPGVPGVPTQISEADSGTLNEIARVPSCSEEPAGTPRTPSAPSGVPHKQLNLWQEHREHREHQRRLKQIRWSWHTGLSALDVDKPRGGFSPLRWARLVEDAISIFNEWQIPASEYGYDATDLWGVDPADANGSLIGGLAVRLDRGNLVRIELEIIHHTWAFTGRPARLVKGRGMGLIPLWELKE